MKVKLLRETRIKHAAGEIVEVSPAEYSLLVSGYYAVPVDEEIPETPEENRKPVKKAKK